jgi:hypothetical protein
MCVQCFDLVHCGHGVPDIIVCGVRDAGEWLDCRVGRAEVNRCANDVFEQDSERDK